VARAWWSDCQSWAFIGAWPTRWWLHQVRSLLRAALRGLVEMVRPPRGARSLTAARYVVQCLRPSYWHAGDGRVNLQSSAASIADVLAQAAATATISSAGGISEAVAAGLLQQCARPEVLQRLLDALLEGGGVEPPPESARAAQRTSTRDNLLCLALALLRQGLGHSTLLGHAG
jgi:hypothetical protein